MAEEKTMIPGLLDPLDNDPIISPGEIVGGDSITLWSSLPSWDDCNEIEYLNGEYLMGLIQGLSISSSRAMRSIYQVGKVDPLIISSIGSKTMNMASIVSEDTNLIKSLYKCLIENRSALESAQLISPSQKQVLDIYSRQTMPEGLPRDLMRIPFGLLLVFSSGDGDVIQMFHLGHCLISNDSNSVEAGTRGIGGSDGIMWQKTTSIN